MLFWWLQAHGLDRETLAKREVVKIDIANDPVESRVNTFQILLFDTLIILY